MQEGKWKKRSLASCILIKIYRTTILSVVLYGCETWSLTLREESRLRVFENTVMRRIFGPKRDEVKREWKKLHNEELYGLYSSSNIVQVVKSRMGWSVHVARMGRGEGYTWFWGGNLWKRDRMEDLDIDGLLILMWVSRKWDGVAWT